MYTWVRFDIERHIAVDIILCTVFIASLSCRIFWSEKNVVLFHSTALNFWVTQNQVTLVLLKTQDNDEKIENKVEKIPIIRVAGKIGLKSRT